MEFRGYVLTNQQAKTAQRVWEGEFRDSESLFLMQHVIQVISEKRDKKLKAATLNLVTLANVVKSKASFIVL